MRPALLIGYVWFCGVFLLLQGVSTLAAHTFPAIDEAFPSLLRVTQMVPAHSMLHIVTALIAFWTLRRGARAMAWFAGVFGLFYVGLAAVGYATGSSLGLGLQTFDHPFHLLLGALGLIAVGAQAWRHENRT